MSYCTKCFVNLEKEKHKPYCPDKAPFEMPAGFDEIFKGFNKKKQNGTNIYNVPKKD
jgi:hypothetical protein